MTVLSRYHEVQKASAILRVPNKEVLSQHTA